MCVMSMVMDHYKPRFPQQQDWTFTPTYTPPGVDLGELRKLIDEFKAAVAAARVVDKATAQPDCEDPEKATLIARVDELERRLAEVEGPKPRAERRRRARHAATPKAEHSRPAETPQ